MDDKKQFFFNRMCLDTNLCTPMYIMNAFKGNVLLINDQMLYVTNIAYRMNRIRFIVKYSSLMRNLFGRLLTKSQAKTKSSRT